MLAVDVSYSIGNKKFRSQHKFDTQKITFLYGPSGSGKTTFLNMLSGIKKPHSGSIYYDGKCLFNINNIDVPIHKRRIAYMQQGLNLFPHLSVKKNIEYGLNKSSASKVYNMKSELEDILELSSVMNKKPFQLSGGEKQRVALARSLLAPSDIVLFDEPLSSLDIRLKEKILAWLKEFHKTESKVIIYVTHDQFEKNFFSCHKVTFQKNMNDNFFYLIKMD